MPRTVLILCCLVVACSKHHAGAPAPWDAGFRGPGRLALIFEPGDPEQKRALVVHDREGAFKIDVDNPRAVRWISAHVLIVSQELPPEEEYGLPRTQLLRVDTETGAIEKFATPARWFDAEPDPEGKRLAAGLEVDDQGESELLLFSLASHGERPLADAPKALDRPRWSPDGESLVVLQTVSDPDGADSATVMSVDGQEIAFPRLYRVSADLTGKLSLLRDGDPGGPLVAGGSLPLWWDARGVYARQRRGLVLCDPQGSGCKVVFTPGGDQRVYEGCPAGPDRALLLVREHAEQLDAELPQSLVQIDLGTGNAQPIYQTPRDVFLSDIDWIAAP